MLNVKGVKFGELLTLKGYKNIRASYHRNGRGGGKLDKIIAELKKNYENRRGAPQVFLLFFFIFSQPVLCLSMAY
jgi:hypothetical protein